MRLKHIVAKPTITLDSANEFEAVLIDIVSMHRIKAASYGSDSDPMYNFVIGGDATNQTPLRYGEALMQKHSGAIRQWFGRHQDPKTNPKHTPTSDDGFLDRAVYAVLQLALYRRDA